MKLGVFTVLFGDTPFEETLDLVAGLGLQAVELGTGAYPGNAHCNPAQLLGSERKLAAFREAIAARGLTISALSCHGNPLHPDREDEETTARYAEKAGIAPPTNLDWLFAYNLFRLAAICQGIAGRVRDGTASSAHAKSMAAQVPLLAEAAWSFAKKAGA